MKWLLLILTIVSGFTPLADGENLRVLTVSNKSKISILGSSNVNQFSLDIKEYSGKDTLVLVKKNNQPSVNFKNGVLRIPVTDFKNSNPVLTRDFRKIVKAREYPEILLIFRTLTAFPCPDNQTLSGEADVVVCLAGASKIIKVNVTTCRTGETVFMDGTASLLFSDFGLKPPKNVMGFINVKDELKVNFRLSLTDLTEKLAYRK